VIHIAGLTMKMYMSREGCDPYNWLKHEDVYVKRGLESYLLVYQTPYTVVHILS
jgi:hypothetical protein